ncbi:MAG: DUF2807 domain-containing protein [Bacteroidales bacterium]|nr:DUF2807 domain-containing protein [Bacteroidales bacterium]
MKSICHSLFSGLLCGLIVLATTACDNRDIHQVIKEIAEAPVDTTGLTPQTVQTNHFSGVEIDCFADVTFHQTAAGTAPYVRLMALDDVLAHVSTKATDDMLYISTDRRYRMPEKAVVVIDLYAPFVSSFTLNGGKCLRLGKLQLASPLTLEVDGIGTITSDSLLAPEISVKLDGAGSIDLKGIQTRRLNTSLMGNGNVYLSGRTETASVSIEGVGQVHTDSLHSATPIKAVKR